MRGSKLAEIVEGEINREKRMKDFYERRKLHKEKCSKCKNRKTDICHITRDIEGNLKCAFYEE